MNIYFQKNFKTWILFLIGIVFVVGLISAGLTGTPLSFGATNITSTDSGHWAWNDVIGWINFYETDSVMVKPKEIEGWASSSIGVISLNCNPISNPDGDNLCGIVPYKVLNNGSGTLSGWAWNDVIGWISFCGNSYDNGCATSSVQYGVPVLSRVPDEPPSDFWGLAWSDVIGWISFNCDDYGDCGVSDYRVTTDWFATSTFGEIDSVVFDTGVLRGAQFNSIGWRGSLPVVSTRVRFKLATSNCEGGSNPLACDSDDAWDFMGPSGSGVTGSFYDAPEYMDLGASKIYLANITNLIDHHNKRYFRYRIKLISDSTQNYTPRVEEVFVNYSP
jgi:hypothetical protein